MKNSNSRSVLRNSFAAFAFFIFCVLFTCVTDCVDVHAASKQYYFTKESANSTVYYSEDNFTTNYVCLYVASKDNKAIKATDIKSLKTSSNVKAFARPGYIKVYIRGTGTATISCKIKGVKVSTKLNVLPYENPFKTFSVGSKSFKTYFNKTPDYFWYHTNRISNSNLTIKVKSGWKIVEVAYSSPTNKKTSVYNSSSVSMAGISLFSNYDEIKVTLYNKKLKQNFTYILHGYTE